MKKHSNLSLAAILLLAVLVASPVVYLILSAVNYQRDYRAFTYQLSLSTVYCTEKDCLKAQQGDDTVRVSYYHTYTVFGQFTRDKPKPRREAPETAPDLTLDYGDGSYMECWAVRLEDTAARRNGVFFRFTAPDGRTWMYDTDAFNIQGLLRPTALSQNEPW